MNQNGFLVGVDEVGRGPLAGPVVAAAVILDPNGFIKGIKDSKKLSDKMRRQLSEIIMKNALAYAFGRAEVFEIEQLNIHHASLLAMKRAVLALAENFPQYAIAHVIVDGKFCPDIPYSCEAIIGGDRTELAIGAASIIAKVCRDDEMMLLDELYPGYGLAVHKGYPTAAHCKALTQLGVSEIHRRTYGPCQAVLVL